MKVKSFNLDDDVAEHVESQPNQSEYVNRVLRNVMEGYGPEGVILDYRIEQEKARYTRTEHQLEGIKENINELEDRKERQRDSDMDVVREFVKRTSDSVDLSPDAPPMQNWSEGTGYSPREFANKVRELRGENV